MSDKWKIGKEFNFEYGHTVHAQTLNPEYSLDCNLCCRHLHGHSGKLIVYLDGDTLDERGYFCDFKELNWFKKFIDDELDHKMIIDINDPGIHHIVPEYAALKDHIKTQPQGHMIVNPDYFKTLADDRLIEILSGFVFVDFVPTSENLSKWLCNTVHDKMSKIGVNCPQVQFFETAKSQCNYYR